MTNLRPFRICALIFRSVLVSVLWHMIGSHGILDAAEVSRPQWKSDTIAAMNADASRFSSLSRQIWELAELSFQEHESSRLLAAELKNAGFQIQTNLGGIPTAFMASWGSGSPVIAILGEYDALPGLKQDAIPEKRPIGFVGAGHGCGHNLLGTGAAFAAIAVKASLSRHHLTGTIRYYGCPAEENGSGKIHLARAGVFEGCDLALTWHPDDRNEPGVRTTLANQSATFTFRGVAAHAARAPEKGRSALDAVMVMTHAVELLREHVPPESRIHYFISNGGAAANVVPELAQVKLIARHPDSPTLDGIWSRIMKCAEAGALATETSMEFENTGGLANVLPNDRLAALSSTNMNLVGGVDYNVEELQFAQRIRKLLPPEGLPPEQSASTVFPVQEGVTSWSTDVGDISWQLPTGEIRAAVWVPGVAPHTWQATACSGMSIGQKAMVVAAKTIALTALDIFRSPGLVQEVKQGFDKRLAGHKYRCRMPPGAKPKINPPDPTKP